MGKLEGQVAVITGGASGIGEGAVRKFVVPWAERQQAAARRVSHVTLPEYQ